MFDPGLIEFGGISLIAMVFGLVEFFKGLFKIEGKWVTVLAGAMGLLVLGIVEALQFLPAGYTQAAEATKSRGTDFIPWWNRKLDYPPK